MQPLINKICTCLVTCINVGVRVQRYGHSKRKEIIVVLSEGLESDAAGFSYVLSLSL